MIYTAQGLTYPQALKLIEDLKAQGIEGCITSGGVSIQATPDQINQAQSICLENGASFDAGFSAHEENILIRNGSIDFVERVTDNAIAVLQEWDEL